MKRAAIFVNGIIAHPETIPGVLLPGDLVIAADGGGTHCAAMGIVPHVVIGDLDSISEEELSLLREQGAQIIQHPPQKDETDLELAIQHAIKCGVDSIVLFGMLGGRWDMTLANLLLLAYPLLRGIDVRVLDGPQEMFLLQGESERDISGKPGDIVSVLPLGEQVTGITYKGLTYPLVDGTLEIGSPRGVSNSLTEETAHISIREGRLLCVVYRWD